METPTKVVFRKFKTGEVIALFPTLIGTNDVYTCQTYMHIGQHMSSMATSEGTLLATEAEYMPLAKELESIGYVLDIQKRITSNDKRIRAKQLHLINYPR